MNLLFQKLKRGEVSGQIVVVTVLILAVIIVFVAVTINLGTLALKKTHISIAADSAAIGMASAAGSYAVMLTKGYYGGLVQMCEGGWLIRFLTFISRLIMIAAVAVAVWQLMAATGATTFLQNLLGEKLGSIVLGKALVGAVGSAALGIGLGAEMYSYYQREKNLKVKNENLQKQMAEMQEDQTFFEDAIGKVFFALAVDPVEVTDWHDIDQNGNTTDKVGRFALLYSERVARLVASKAKEQSAWYSWHDSLGWHHVKVEIEVLCTDTTEDCEGNVTGFSFPYLKHTKCGALDDCWTIVPKLRGANGGGAAKIKVIRSDENRSPLSFISGKPLWQIRYSHPQKPGEPSVSTLGNCFPGDWAPGAINSSDPAFSLGAAGFNCDGSDVDTSLQYGIMSISCVEWSFQAGGVKFIPCTFYDLMKSNVNTYCKYDAN